MSGIPVFHSSEAGGSEPDNVGLQFLTIPSGAGTTMPKGTVYADYANTHKSGTYLHNLTTILADDAAAMPGRLDYTISNEPQTVHDLLLQKSDGTFELAVWNDRPGGA